MGESIGCRKVWNLYSTGAGEGYQTNGVSREYTWYVEAVGSSRSTANIEIQTARLAADSTGARYVSLGTPSTFAISSASLTVIQMTGPFLAVRPYVSAMGSTGAVGSTGVHLTIELVGN